MKVSIIIAAIVVLLGTMAISQTTPQPTPDAQPSPTHKMSKAEKQQAQGKILDLNTASKEELAALPGVGPSYAQKIIDGRPYKDKRDLLRKRVLPENIYNQIKDRVIARRETIKAKPKDAPTNREQ